MATFVVVLATLFVVSMAHPIALQIPSAVTYGVWPTAGYYTSSKSINVGLPRHISYSSMAPFFYGFQPAPAVVGSQYHAQDSLGHYSFGYTNSDGQAKIESKGMDGKISGKYIFVDPTGRLIETSYTADEDGFKVEGEHLPQVPNLPEVPKDLADAFEKAKEDFEEAKNREAPVAQIFVPAAVLPTSSSSSSAGVSNLPVATQSVAATAPLSSSDKSAFTYSQFQPGRL